jgi:hypothetical protein
VVNVMNIVVPTLDAHVRSPHFSITLCDMIVVDGSPTVLLQYQLGPHCMVINVHNRVRNGAGYLVVKINEEHPGE